jgi:hypothetical protein
MGRISKKYLYSQVGLLKAKNRLQNKNKIALKNIQCLRVKLGKVFKFPKRKILKHIKKGSK